MTRRAIGTALLALVALLGAFLGAFAADPLGTLRLFGEASMRADGAHAEFFGAPDGTTLRALVAGPLSAERPVVLLHGLGADATYWAFTVHALRKAGRTVIVPDAPGSGGSDTPATDDGFSLPARVAAVEALGAALRLDRFDLVGHSLGGATAGLVALAHPERIGTLVLVDASGFSRATAEQIENFEKLTRPRTRDEGRRLMGLLFFRTPLPPVGVVVDGLSRRFREPNVRTTIEEARRADVLRGREAALPRGTVVIWGGKESLFPVADAKAAVAKIPGGTLHVVEGAGHDVPLEAPGAFLKILLPALGAR